MPKKKRSSKSSLSTSSLKSLGKISKFTRANYDMISMSKYNMTNIYNNDHL